MKPTKKKCCANCQYCYLDRTPIYSSYECRKRWHISSFTPKTRIYADLGYDSINFVYCDKYKEARK